MRGNKIIEELREELHKMIEKNLDPKLILKLSQELDIHIVEEMKKNISILNNNN